MYKQSYYINFATEETLFEIEIPKLSSVDCIVFSILVLTSGDKFFMASCSSPFKPQTVPNTAKAKGPKIHPRIGIAEHALGLLF